MDLAEAKQKLNQVDKSLIDESLAIFEEFDTPYGVLRVFITDRLRRKCRKGKIWKSSAMLTALKNAAYGFDVTAARSRGGVDGIFQIDRAHKPVNSMMKKLFDQFLDKPDPLVAILLDFMDLPIDHWFPVRLVSHHMRLLGILSLTYDHAQLVLVDYDNEKGN